MRILIIGAGGHGQVVADILHRAHSAGERVIPVGYLDDNPALQGREILHLPILGKIKDLPNICYEAIIIAVGSNKQRMCLSRTFLQQNQQLALACHPASIIGVGVQLSHGTMICAGVVINTGTHIGANVILNTGCTVDHHNEINDFVHIAPGAHLGGEVTIGEGALVGIGASVMPRKRVGRWSIVGAGALVHKDVPDGVVVAGVPAKVIREAKIPF